MRNHLVDVSSLGLLVFVAACSGVPSEPTAPRADEPQPDLVPEIGPHQVEMPGLPDEHEVGECVVGHDPKSLVRFEATIRNDGAAKFNVGDPTCSADDRCEDDRNCLNPAYCYDATHGHPHVKGLTKYWIETMDGTVLPATGRKQGFALTSNCGPSREDEEPGSILPGCRDTYSITTPCQLVDSQRLEPGTYRLFAEVNPDPRFVGSNIKNDCGSTERGERQFVESSYSNNCTSKEIEIPKVADLTIRLPHQPNQDNDGTRWVTVTESGTHFALSVWDAVRKKVMPTCESDINGGTNACRIDAAPESIRLEIGSNWGDSVYVEGVPYCLAPDGTRKDAELMNGKMLVVSSDCIFNLKWLSENHTVTIHIAH